MLYFLRSPKKNRYHSIPPRLMPGAVAVKKPGLEYLPAAAERKILWSKAGDPG
jgi:hypothetical protein